MSTSRRSFLRASSLAGVAAAITATFPSLAFGKQTRNGKPIIQSLPKEVYDSALYSLSRANFYSNIGTNFSFDGPATGKGSLKLIEVADLRSMWGPDRPEGKECFALSFVGPLQRPLKQGTYSLMHNRLGPIELFIVPSDEGDRRGLRYEANINRLYP